MKKLLLILSIAGILASCSNGEQRKKGVYYNPEPANKPLNQEVGSLPRSQSNEFLEAFESSKVTLTVLSPAIEGDISYESAKQITFKLLRLVTSNGIACLGGDPTFALVPVLSLQSKGTTATVPSKMTVTYTMTLYVGNMLTGEVYESTEINIMGVGNSYEKAMINAVNGIDNSREIKQMLANASKKIVNNYEKEPYAIINKANEYIAKDDIDYAYLLLSSVPDAAVETYALVQEYLPKVQEMIYLKHSENLLLKMKDAITKAGNTYSPEVTAYHQLIPAGAEQRQTADALYDAYMGKLDEYESLKIEQEIYKEREEIACRRLELELKVQANQELIESYKKLAESRTQSSYTIAEGVPSETYLVGGESYEEPYNETVFDRLGNIAYRFGDIVCNAGQITVSDMLGFATRFI